MLNLVVGSKIPSFDGHKESTFGMIHPIRPFYSLLLRVDPNNPQSPTAFQCDVCEGEMPTPTNDGKRYTFKIKKNVTFHDGQKMTAHDVVATHQKIIFPGKGVASVRKGFFGMVEKISAPDDYTVVFDLNMPHPASAGSPTPFNFIYSKADMEKHGMAWHQKNINGTGAFEFVSTNRVHSLKVKLALVTTTWVRMAKLFLI